jgi:hypothetical protein
MNAFFPHRALYGLLFGLVLALSLAARVVYAACDPGTQHNDSCSAQHLLSGALGAISGRTSPANAPYPAIDQPRLPMSGALFHTDFQALEERARTLLERNLKFREDISPYRKTNSFEKLISQLDAASGLNVDYNDGGTPVKLLERLNTADRELREARDLYAFLVVYADEARLRRDDTTRKQEDRLCARPEEPNPADPQHTGQVLDPVIDWCNFRARLRQSAREAATIRLILGQQFNVKALGMHFSAGQLLGGEQFVRQEIANLQAAIHQYELAERGLSQALDTVLATGCYLSDFYTETEWSLLMRAVTSKERAQHEIATRQSYLGDYGATTDARVGAATASFRASTMEQYVKMVSSAGLMANPTPCVTRSGGEQPNGAALAEMVQNMLDTRAKVRHLGEGRNIFGFDVRFTPAAPFGNPGNPNDPAGLWNQAHAAALLAHQIQARTISSARDFDLNQQDLIKAINEVKQRMDITLNNVASCDSNSLTSDNELASCVNRQIELISACIPSQPNFEACLANPAILGGSTLKQSRQELRAAYLEIIKIQKQLQNNGERQIAESNRNARIRSEILTNGDWQAGFAVAETLANAASVSVDSKGEVTVGTNPGAPAAAAARAWSTVRQAITDAEIANAESAAALRNLVLDLIELQADLDVAVQQYNAKYTEYEGYVSMAQKALLDSLRQRAYIASSPANDPAYRIVRDSLRLQLSEQMERAARLSYLAAKRAEYEFATRLSASGFAISTIYRARTAEDVLTFLNALRSTTDNLKQEGTLNRADFKLSVAQHVLGLTDEALGLTGEAAQTERERHFRAWVARQTVLGADGKPQLVFDFTTSAARNGIFSNVIQQGYEHFWLHKLSSVGVNLVTAQPAGYRTVTLTQGGSVHLRSQAGCIFDYRLIAPAALLGLEWPSNQPAEAVSTVFKSQINGANGDRSTAFVGRSVSATAWQVTVFAGSPEMGLPDLDLQQLSDIELHFSTTYASRAAGDPRPSDCVRIDF